MTDGQLINYIAAAGTITYTYSTTILAGYGDMHSWLLTVKNLPVIIL